MSNLCLSNIGIRIQKYIGIIVLGMVLMIITSSPGVAAAGDAGDVVTAVAKNNLSSPEFVFGAEPVPGGKFKFYEALEGTSSNWRYISVSEPVDGANMQAVLDFENKQLEDEIDLNIIGTKSLQGYELLEYTAWKTVGVRLILPDYLIKVEVNESDNDSTVDFKVAKDLAQRVMVGLIRNGLISQPAEENEQKKPAGEGEKASAATASVTGKPLGDPVEVANTDNIYRVDNGPTAPTTFTINSPHLVTYIRNYHWNYAKGSTPGKIGLKDQNGKIYGPWQASGIPGQGGVPNAYWEVFPNIVIPAGTYTVTDSEPSTWAQNEGTGGRGMCLVKATPHFEADGKPANGSTKGSPGSLPSACDWTESPAGVGSVGNIPGPSNTIEALVGVAVPGLLATLLGALAGLGGGGGGLTPPAGTPILPTSGGPATGAGSYPGAGAQSNASAQEFGQLGRRRRESQPTSTPNEPVHGPEIIIDTVDMIDSPGALTTEVQGTPIDNDLFIETTEESSVLIKPEAGIYIESAEESGVLTQTETEAIIDTEDEEAVLIQDYRTIQPDSTLADSTDNGILIDTSAFDEPAKCEVDGSFQEAETAKYDEFGFNTEGYDRNGYDKNGFDKEGFNKDGFNRQGYGKNGFDRDGYDTEGYDVNGYDRKGYNRSGYDASGYDKQGYNKEGFNREGFDKAGYDVEGFNRKGFNKEGFDRVGFNQKGFNQKGFDKNGFDKEGFNKEGFNKDGFNRQGYGKNGFDRDGYDTEGYDVNGYDRNGYNRSGYDASGYDKQGYNKEGFNREGFDKAGYDVEGFNRKGFNKEGFDRAGFNQKGFDKNGFDKEGFNKDGFDRQGYGKNGFDREGYDREGYDVNGYDRKGYNRSGYDVRGYDKKGYDKEGFNKEGCDRDGYDRNGLNKDGYDRDGYDKTGYDREGYDREGYDRHGRQREGYDEYGYDQDGFNKDGFDRDGYDRGGFDYEGYSRSGYDPWGYDRQGYDKEGYHWSGYNTDGYNRAGLHWSENPYEGDSPFNVDTRNPFDGGSVIISEDNYGNKVNTGIDWKPTKPPLGEPYSKTVEKYGAKPWTTEPTPEVEKPSAPEPQDSGIIGPEDPMNTLKNHETGQTAPDPLEGKESLPVVPGEQEGPESTTAADEQASFPEGAPDTGADGIPQHGDTIILIGKGDGKEYPLEYDSKTGEWKNLLTGGSVPHEELESYKKDFDRWQNDLGEDLRRSRQDIEKMSQRQDANSKAIDQNLNDWKKLDQMQKVAKKYGIGEKGGPGDVDKAIQDLKNDMLEGKEIDRNKMEKINRVIDSRINGKSSADNGERWEEKPWYKDVSSALKANAEMAREVVTGEDSEGNISVLGMTARIMITAATGAGAAQAAMDGALTVAEAMYRVKDSIDKGESDFRAVSKAIGMVILEEEIGRLVGAAGEKISKEMLERYPALVNKAADFVEDALLKVSKANQTGSAAIGLISKESAEQAIKNIEKQIAELGSEVGEEGLEKATKTIGRDGASSADAAASGAGKTIGKDSDNVASKPTKLGKESSEQSINRGGRSAEEVLNDPATVAKAEEKLQNTIKNYESLPPSKQQELIKEQAIYDEYRILAEEKTWNMADKVQRGDKLTVEDALEMKSDPASMRTLKNMEKADGMGAELGTGGVRKVQTEFNNVLIEKVYQPSYKDVQNHLSAKYNGAEIRVDTVRTPGKEYHPWDVNTDNDIIALRKVVGKDGKVEWVEIPRSEWEDIYYKSYAKNTGFDPGDAASKFPDENWRRMSDTEQARRWAELHGESPTDVYHPEAARDFSTQRSAMTKGEQPLRPGAAQAADGEGRLVDSEGLGLMEEYKINHYWEKGDLRSQTEALEQLKKTGAQTRNLEQGYKNMGYKIDDMPDNMKQALQIVEDSKLSPAARAARLQELGYESPGDLANKIASRIGALRAATK